jgi:hypothetical protein
VRRLVATALLTHTLAACTSGPEPIPFTYDQTCATPTEDSVITCQLDPTARYEYDHGMWHTTSRESAPTGAELTR